MNKITETVNQKFNYFLYSLVTICIAYCIYELIYIPYWALSADEFVFARHIFEYTQHVPYKDFPPYKTILGYYLLSIPLFISHSLLAPLFYIKDEIAIINTVCLALATWWGSRFFAKQALLLTVLAIVANQLFLLYGTDLRVDMLTSWMCLFAALSVLDNRIKLAGILIGLAFLISQKALWAFVAMNGGMLICYLLFSNSRYTLRSLLIFNALTIGVLSAYVLFWSFVSTPNTVLYNLFYEAYIQAGIDWYTPIYLTCWLVVLNHGPILFLLWPLAFFSLAHEYANDAIAQRRVFILTFASISLLLFISYKQAFPYNFVFTIPAVFLLYADFISWLFHTKNFVIEHRYISWMYASLIFLVVYCAGLPNFYLSIGFIPLLIGNSQIDTKLKLNLALGIFILSGIAFPLLQAFKTSDKIDGSYQQNMLNLTHDLLAEDGDYISGIPYLYNKNQPIDGMQNLIGPALEYLYLPTNKLATLLLPSLYLSPTSNQQILLDFEAKPIKVIIDNYRIKYLPPEILAYINSNYQQYNGSVYLYAPSIPAKQLTFNLKFSGQYKITADKAAKIKIDNKKAIVNSVMQLQKGDHLSDANNNYRLVLTPKLKSQYHVEAEDKWTYMIKAIIS